MGRPGPPGVSMRERFLRNEMLLGPRALERLAAAHVCVIGLGGVGSYAVEALARAGVGELTLVDQDVYGESNLNRQLGALYSTLGRGKAEVLARRVRDINPDCVVHPVVGRYAGSTSLAAVGATTSIVFLLVTLFNGVSIGANYLTARYYGAGDREAISQTVFTRRPALIFW